ncbi:MAG TPA: ABC transporter permease [Bryobacteraceae bacterium]|jgi:predicted permease|nr:ABC transporter permease [Bryobacteraceae bacterium]
MPALWKDSRYAVRALLKTPGYTVVAVATLALGIGANTAIFSVVNQVLLNPAGVAHPERIVSLRVHYDKLALHNIGVSIPDFADVQHSTQQFDSAALIDHSDFNYTGSTVPERLRGASVTWRWFDVFGAKPKLGRVFQPEEDRPNANQEVVLSYAAWKRLFGQDAAAIGRTIEMNQLNYRIVGVMGPEFRWPVDVDLWVPLGLANSQYTEGNRFNESYEAVARTKPGLSFASANAYVEVLSSRLRNNGAQGGAYAKDAAWGMFLLPFTDFIAGDTKTPMLVLLGAVGFVLLIACSNIAGLMLARASGRSREIAIRAALGAGRWDLIRQSLAESLMLAFAGALAGLGVAFAGMKGLLALAPEGLPIAVGIRMDPAVLAFTALAAIAAGILFGVAPAWQISRLDRYKLLKEGGRANTGGLGRQRLRAALVVAEVALALVLLVGAGLFLRSLAALEDVNPGFEPQGVITAGLSLPATHYADPGKRIAFYRAVLGNLATLPGVTAVAGAIPVPFSGDGGSASFSIEGRPTPPGDPGPHGDISWVSPDYFATLKIPIRRGRVFTDGDRQDTEAVALVDEALARQYWPNEDPIGRHIRWGRTWHTIVGVVGHVKNADLGGEDVKGRYYFPIYQSPPPFMRFMVRTPSDPARLAAGIRGAVRTVDSTQPVSQVRLLPEMVNSSLAPRRFVVTVLSVFAGMALLMAVIGLYGVIGYAVTQRTQELGVRMALGAQGGEILRLVLGQGMRLAGAGAAIGLAVSLIASRLLRHELFHVSSFDPLTFTLMAAVLIGAALLASYIPARRATRVDPMVALRYE